MEPLDDFDAATIASGWHSVNTWNDPGVNMYSVTSTGRVHSEAHRAALIDYIDRKCLPQAASLDEHSEEPMLPELHSSNVEELRALRAWALAYDINTATEGTV